MRGDATAALLDAGAAVSGEEVLRADPLAHRAQQDPLKIGPQQRDVRPLVAGGLAERFAIDELAVAGEERVVLRLAGGRDQLILEAERAQLLHRMGADIDADAQRPHLGRRLEQTDCARRATRLKREGQRQSTDPTADDDDVHRALLARWNRGKSTPPAALVCTRPDCKIPAAIYGAPNGCGCALVGAGPPLNPSHREARSRPRRARTGFGRECELRRT